VLYVGSLIIMWIVLAAALGFAIGWMVKGRRGMHVKKRRKY
jgi:hypothetical protein